MGKSKGGTRGGKGHYLKLSLCVLLCHPHCFIGVTQLILMLRANRVDLEMRKEYGKEKGQADKGASPLLEAVEAPLPLLRKTKTWLQPPLTLRHFKFATDFRVFLAEYPFLSSTPASNCLVVYTPLSSSRPSLSRSYLMMPCIPQPPSLPPSPLPPFLLATPANVSGRPHDVCAHREAS